MNQFRTSLLREKFIIRPENAKPDDDKDTVIALSNRIVITLTTAAGKDRETYVIRTQNMHSCVRLAAVIAKEYYDRGPIMPRRRKYYWQDGWREVTKGYEKDWNPDIWCAIYHKGKIVFDDGEHHPFLDIIEQCDTKNNEEYDQSIVLAEHAFQQAGKKVKIDHDANVALVMSIDDSQAKGGVILRRANKATTFNFNAKPLKTAGTKIKIASALTFSAAFLEGIQLAFLVGMTHRKRAYDLIEKGSDDDKKGERASDRLANLNRAISQFEQHYDVHYRPDRPSFPNIVNEAEDFATDLLKPQIEAMLRSGQLDESEWIS